MSLVDHIFNPRQGSTNLDLPRAYEATIIDNASTVDDLVHVVIPSIDNGFHKHGPCAFMPRVSDAGAVVKPQAGDRALVVISERQAVWIVTWHPNG